MNLLKIFMLGILIVYGRATFAQAVQVFPASTIGKDKTKPIPSQLRGQPNCVRVNNDDETVIPAVFHDSVSGIYYYVESDGRHVTAFTSTGNILWHRNPFVDAGLEPYRYTKPIIAEIGRDVAHHLIYLLFNSSQCGTLNEKTGDLQFVEQD